MNKISKKWSELSGFLFKNKEGKHCHWCKFIQVKDGAALCNSTKSKYYKKRIRSHEGVFAKECKYFEIKEWYCKDENYKRWFK